MGRRKKLPITEDFSEAMSKFSHLKEYVKKVTPKMGEPEYHLALDRNLKFIDFPNIIYPVGDPMFVHIYKERGIEGKQYVVIEPSMGDDVRKKYDEVMDRMIELANRLPVPDKTENIGPVLIKIFDEAVQIKGTKETGIKGMFSNKKIVSKPEYDIMRYFLLRDRVGYSKLEPLFNDPYLEDIHCVGVGNIKCIHKVFEMIHTNLIFRNDLELNKYILETSERVERPVSDARSVVDAIMPDGSRVNFIYGREISLEGSSFTVRKFSDVPVSITQVVSWGTMSDEIAAYIWLALENGMNMFVCGETASGKTTTLNACVAFIKPDAKVYTVENTPEVTIPHSTWQHLVTREAGKDTDVTMFHLLLAALRSRPNYIIVGEIRGTEGNVAFQAMQTGHPVISTFHAGSPHSMIQRLTGHPIDVPIAFIDNLNIVLIQQAVSSGGHFVRRILSVTEIERYYEAENRVITRQVFSWEPNTDSHRFRGLYNSYILEKKIAQMIGFEDPREIYEEMMKRKKILQAMVKNEIFNYYDVWEVIKKFNAEGIAGLPFTVEGYA
ncbi:hypothetical protein COV93_00375 [Candidatus Woesearchaeota archaeon CG11_big_fil_rev_8_21_14_0_20_43_8]|nr:MAG: hypothetical protein COV93_00375 [Candidatus Woesearchaeota archaeon CG11_big_fil_rev_8_21_14_0_20_43_8]